MNNRSKVFIVFLNIIFVFLLLRLFQLQVVEHRKYSKIANENAARITPILAPRGIIFDRNGKVLLKNKPVISLYIIPHLLPKDKSVVFSKLAAILKKNPYEVERSFIEGKRPIFEGVLIESDLPISLVSRIEEKRDELPGVEIISYPLRSYVNKKILSHVLGYVGEIEQRELRTLKDEGYRLGDLIGKDGVEKQYDKYLRGVSGGKKFEVDSLGKPQKVLEVVDPVPGNNIALTIDIDLQLKAEEALGNKEGAVVVMNPKTGEILAMASHPSYDAEKKWNAIDQRRHPFMNRAVSSYPPGSTFKVVTLSAALEEGIAKPEEIFSCPGFYRLGRRVARCWKETGHGIISAVEGLVWSCDIVFYDLGKRLGPELMKKYSNLYGLGEKTGIDLPNEKRGFVPDTAWKKERFNDGWYNGDSINMGIGQGFTQVTPLQLAALYGEIATGMRVKPYVVKNVFDLEGKIIFQNTTEVVAKSPISKENNMLLKNALRDVVLRGTGIAAYIKGCEASGKTGTAENPGRPHAWFICFAPNQDPEIVIASFVAHGEHGDRVSAYIARDLLKWYKENRLKTKYEERERPEQYIMHGGFKEYYKKITLDSD